MDPTEGVPQGYAMLLTALIVVAALPLAAANPLADRYAEASASITVHDVSSDGCLATYSYHAEAGPNGPDAGSEYSAWVDISGYNEDKRNPSSHGDSAFYPNTAEVSGSKTVHVDPNWHLSVSASATASPYTDYIALGDEKHANDPAHFFCDP